ALNIVMGVVAAALPVTAVFAFVIITAAWALISGGLMIAAAFKLHESHGRWWLAIGGVISVIWGVLLVLSPVIGAVVLTWWLGAYAFVFGVALIVLAFRLKARKDDTPGSAAARAA
ncbi:MAG: HdeD family acid-resistance protein, partial [Microvirga sp.]